MSKNFIDMVIGNFLGNAHISRTGLDKAYITFEQTKKKVEYINYLHKTIYHRKFSFRRNKKI